MSARKRWLMLILAVAVAILLAAGLAVAEGKFTPISGFAWMTALPEGGDVKCIGGAPSGLPWPACTPGSKTQIRGMNLTYRQQADTPLLTGDRTIVFNYQRTVEDGRSHAWGTWRVVLDNGISVWEGTFTGFGGDVPNQGQIVGQGTEGEVEGMQLRATYAYEDFPGLETITGYMLNPKDSK